MNLAHHSIPLLAAGILLCSQIVQAADSYSRDAEIQPGEAGQIARDRARRKTLDGQEKYRLRIAIPHATGDDVVRSPLAQLPPAPEPSRPSWIESNREVAHMGLALVLIGGLVVRVLIRHRQEAEIRALSGGYLSDGTEVARFKMPDLFAPVSIPEREVRVEAFSRNSIEELQRDPLEEFLAEAPQHIARMRDLVKTLTGQAGEQSKSVLKQLHECVAGLQRHAKTASCRPAWQMSSALELLLKRLADKPKDAGASVIRTVAAAVDVLANVCVANVRQDLLTGPPLKILAVDDDPLCRRSMQFALEKAHLIPDLAEDGDQAVALARQTMYDVVFMDIMMPKMDGLTACGCIHETEKNAETPVVFVTALSDFNTRAQSVLKGGSDLMAKPYLVLELTVKAMTYAIHGRLQPSWQARMEAATKPVAETPVVKVEAFRNDLPAHPSIPMEASDQQGDFFVDAPSEIAETRRMVQELRDRSDAATLHERVEGIYLRVHSVSAKAGLAGLAVAARLGSALEALVTKLYEDPDRITASTLNTAENALRLLETLCIRGLDEKLVAHPPLRTLVADDEPLARRAVSGALQLAFDKPDSAENGAEACVMAAQERYDVIFTDVQMPFMDGIEVCRDIRAGKTNHDTPIVVVTSHNDSSNQARAFEARADDFIGKPFLPIEIAVKALTLAWSARLRRLGVELAAPVADSSENLSGHGAPALANAAIPAT